MSTKPSATSPKPGLWVRMSVAKGNLLQLVGLVIGASLLDLAAHLQAAGAVRVALMLFGFLIIYDCSHAIFHWAVGRLVGIRFRGYGVRGTDHPEAYPPGIRQLMSVMPFFTALTHKQSMTEASPTAKALMFAAGETGTTVVSLLAALYAWRGGIPGGKPVVLGHGGVERGGDHRDHPHAKGGLRLGAQGPALRLSSESWNARRRGRFGFPVRL